MVGINKEKDVAVQIGDFVRKARKKVGIKQGELANKLGTSQAVISRIESGDTCISVFKLLEIFSELGFELLGSDGALKLEVEFLVIGGVGSFVLRASDEAGGFNILESGYVC